MLKAILNSLIGSLVFLLSFGAIVCGCEGTTLDNELIDDANKHNIVNGSLTPIEAVPWQVLVYGQEAGADSGSLCGGSIIDENWILTAAHCVTDFTPEEMLVVAGTGDLAHLYAEGAQQSQAASVIVHPQYTTTRNDLALISLNSALDLSGSKVQAIRMATSDDAAAFSAGRTATVSGWGQTGVNEGISILLQSVQIPIVDNNVYNTTVAQIYADLGYSWNRHVTDDRLVAGEFDPNASGAFKGDSGGPLVVQTLNGPLLAGVVSYGEGLSETNYSLPTVYTSVSHYIDWIMDNVEEVCTPQTLNPIETGLTANNSPAPFVVSASSTISDSRYKEWKAFDNTEYWTQWISDSVFGAYSNASKNFASIQIEMGTKKRVQKYVVRGRFDSLKNRLPKNWVLQGSNSSSPNVNSPVNSSEWHTLDSQTGVDLTDWSSATNRTELPFTLNNTVEFSTYRLVVTAVNGSDVVDIMDIVFYEACGQ